MSIEISFKNKKIKQLCEDERKLIAQYGAVNARKIVRRLSEIEAADSLGMLVQYRIGRCHPLTGDRQGQFALDLEQPLRLIIEPVFECDENWEFWPNVRKIRVVEVTDYHG